MNMEEINGLALCAGIGGLELGLRRALGSGYHCVGYVEREAAAAAILVDRMAESKLDPAPIWDDLSTFDGRPLRGVVDLVSAGFPCQPFSSAGKRLGTQDHRWLWDDISRILREVEPRYIFLENVPGVVQRGMSVVLGTLADLGFDAVWGLFRASDVGAPHKRERWFLLAERRVPDADGHDLRLVPERGQGSARSSDSRNTLAGDVAQAVADSGSERLEGQPPAGTAEEATRRGSGAEVADHDGSGCFRTRVLQRSGTEGEGAPDVGWPSKWPPGPDDERWGGVEAEAQPAVRGMAHGLPSRVDQLRCLGNAVVPEQAELAFRTLRKALEVG